MRNKKEKKEPHKKDEKPILYSISCPLCEMNEAAIVRRSNAKDNSLYLRCTKCATLVFGHNAVLIFTKRFRYKARLVTISREDFDNLLREAIEVH